MVPGFVDGRLPRRPRGAWPLVAWGPRPRAGTAATRNGIGRLTDVRRARRGSGTGSPVPGSRPGSRSPPRARTPVEGRSEHPRPPAPASGGRKAGRGSPRDRPPSQTGNGRDPLRTSRPMVEPHPPRRQRPVPFPKGRTASRRDAASVPPAAPARHAGRPPLRSQRTRGSARCRRRGGRGRAGPPTPAAPLLGAAGARTAPLPGS